MKKLSAVLLGVALTMSLGGLIACNRTKHDPVPGDKNWVDYAHDGSVSLMLDYKGKDFYKDGIGEVTLKSSIDGDTAHFTPVVTTTSSAAIKSRYYGIDTPESTGRIQAWGKEASDFNKKKLKEAAANGTIVISSAQDDYGEPIPDSTGSRYVSLVWINTEKKNARFDELYLLNLEIVEYGYSWVKNVQDMPSYAETFYAAERQAKAYKLALFSGTNGSMDDGDYKDTSLLDLKYATEQYIADPEYQSELNNKRVISLVEPCTSKATSQKKNLQQSVVKKMLFLVVNMPQLTFSVVCPPFQVDIEESILISNFALQRFIVKTSVSN